MSNNYIDRHFVKILCNIYIHNRCFCPIYYKMNSVFFLYDYTTIHR